MVGEIRDEETASLAVNAALTGHLVLSTLHTNSAAGAIPRLVDMKVEPFLLVSTIKVIIAQRLVRRLCASKEQYYLNKDELAQLAKNVDMDRVLGFLREEKVVGPTTTWEKVPFFKAKPSKDCEDGYGGRVSIHEVLKMSPAIRDLIIKGVSSDELEAQAKKEKMMSMLEDGIFMAAQGFTTIEEVLRVVNSE
jgi:type IV pilus assembly protein PilB